MTNVVNSRKALASKAKSGFKKLSLRSIITYVLQLISTLILSRYFIPKDYGIFGILQNWLGSGNYLTDIGLTEGLTQQKEDITREQISAYLFVRLSLATLIAFCFFLGLFFFKDLLELDTHQNLLMYFLGLFAIFDVLSSTPRMLLQKSMNFTKLARIEVVSSVVLYITQISGAILGLGFWSMFAGILGRYLVIILVGLKMNCFVFPRLSNVKEVSSLFKKGIFYQLNLGVIFLVGISTPIILKQYLDIGEVGLYFWANGLVAIPMSIIFNFQNVVFPAISKIQDNESEVKILFNKGTELFLLLIFGIFGLGAALSVSLVDFLFNEKWYGAKEFISYLSFIFIIYSVRQTPLVLLTSLGRSLEKFISEFSFFISLILLSTFLIPSYKILGFIAASFFAHLISFIIGMIFCSPYFYRSFYRNLTSLTIGVCSAFYQINHFQLFNSFFSAFLIFFLNMIIITGALNLPLFKSLINQFKKKSS